MNRFLVYTFLLCQAVVRAQNPVALPLQRDGVWSLVDTTGRTLVQTDYSYIYPFDEEGCAMAISNKGFHVIKADGKSVNGEVYSELKSLGSGLFSTRKNGKTKYVSCNQNATIESESGDYFAKNWVFNELDSTTTNLITGQPFKYVVPLFADWGIVAVPVYGILDQNGRSLLRSYSQTTWFCDKLYLCGVDTTYVLTPSKEGYDRQLLRVNTEITAFQDGVFFSQGGKTSFFIGKEKMWTLPFSYVVSCSDKYFSGSNGSGATLIDRRTLKTVVSGYDSYLPNEEGIDVFKGPYNGLLDNNFRVIIPAKYENYTLLDSGLYQVCVNDFCGLYSTILHREILPPVYSTLEYGDGKVRGNRNRTLTILTIDERHALSDKIVLDNVREIPNFTGLDQKLDRRLFAIGWFTDTSLVDSKSSTYYSVKWGLKHGNDILIRPSFGTVEFLSASPFASVFQGPKLYRGTSVNSFQLYRNSDGKPTSPADLTYVSDEYGSRNYHRVQHTKGYGVVDSTGAFRSMSYLEFGNSSHPLYAIGGIFVPRTKSGRDEGYIQMPECARYASNSQPIKIRNDFGKLVDARWNYLAPGGSPLFSTDFEEAREFFMDRAIVKRGGWGVISTDTVIIPTIYRSVNMVMGEEMRFHVSRQISRFTYFDATRQPLEYEHILRSGKQVFVLERENEKVLIGPNGQEITSEYKSFRFLKNGYIIGRSKGEYAVYNPQGVEIYSGSATPEEVMNDVAIWFTEGRDKFWLIHGDTLRGKVKVRELGNFIVVDADVRKVYTQSGEALPVPEGELYAEGNRLFLHTGTYVKEISTSGHKKYKLSKPAAYINNAFVITGNDAGVYDETGRLMLPLPEIQEYEILADSTVIIQLDKKVWHHYDRNWKLIRHPLPHKRIRALGNGYYLVSGQIPAISSPALNKFVYVNEVIGTAREFPVLIHDKTGYYYLDSLLNRMNDHPFLAAGTFGDGHAIVKDIFGWVIIDNLLRPTSIPSNRQISRVAPGIFTYSDPVVKGVFNADGKIIIPVEYEEVELLPNGYYQAILNGENIYFRSNGTRLLD